MAHQTVDAALNQLRVRGRFWKRGEVVAQRNGPRDATAKGNHEKNRAAGHDQKVLSVAVEDHAEDNNREQKHTLAHDPQPAALDEIAAHDGRRAGRTNDADFTETAEANFNKSALLRRADFTRFLPFNQNVWQDCLVPPGNPGAFSMCLSKAIRSACPPLCHS